MLFLPLSKIVILSIIVILMRYMLRHWMKKHIGGYTGDVLGAAQQIQEITIYLALLALFQVNV